MECRVAAPQDRVHDMDALPDPIPEYFAAIAGSRLKGRIHPTLLFESARLLVGREIPLHLLRPQSATR